MLQYQNGRLFRCASESGARCVVIEQTRIGGLSAFAKKVDYMTDDGDIAHRLNDAHFFLLTKNEVVRVQTMAPEGDAEASS